MERFVMPFKGQMQNSQVILDQCANQIMPVTNELTSEGECISFDTKQLVNVLIIACKLESIGQIRSLVFYNIR